MHVCSYFSPLVHQSSVDIFENHFKICLKPSLSHNAFKTCKSTQEKLQNSQFVLLNIQDYNNSIEITLIVENVGHEVTSRFMCARQYLRMLILCKHHSNQICFKTLFLNQLLGLKQHKTHQIMFF